MKNDLPVAVQTAEQLKLMRQRIDSMLDPFGILAPMQHAYYAWLLQPVSNRDQEDARLLRLIRARSSRATASMGCRASFSTYLKPAKPAASIAWRD